jgi:seryl-tRNA synthetase
MEHQDIQQQVLIEQANLAHIVSALRTTLGWKSREYDFSRKLSSLVFVCESFQRHLKRLLRLEQSEGYMAVVLDSRPELSDEVRGLRRQHTEFRKKLREILARLRNVSHSDLATFTILSTDLEMLLDRLDEHHRREAALLQEALLRDEGGEG